MTATSITAREVALAWFVEQADLRARLTVYAYEQTNRLLTPDEQQTLLAGVKFGATAGQRVALLLMVCGSCFDTMDPDVQADAVSVALPHTRGEDRARLVADLAQLLTDADEAQTAADAGDDEPDDGTCWAERARTAEWDANAVAAKAVADDDKAAQW